MDNQKRIVVIINGKPRSGKDTFCKYIVDYCEKNHKECNVWSTIDREKEILEEILNRQYNPKNSSDRAFLSELKQLCNTYYDITFNDFKNFIEFYDGIFLIQSREWTEIITFREYCKRNNIDFITLYLTNDNQHYNFMNNSDKNCEKQKEIYDYNFIYNGNLEEFKENAEHFCESRLF